MKKGFKKKKTIKTEIVDKNQNRAMTQRNPKMI